MDQALDIAIKWTGRAALFFAAITALGAIGDAIEHVIRYVVGV